MVALTTQDAAVQMHLVSRDLSIGGLPGVRTGGNMRILNQTIPYARPLDLDLLDRRHDCEAPMANKTKCDSDKMLLPVTLRTFLSQYRLVKRIACSSKKTTTEP